MIIYTYIQSNPRLLQTKLLDKVNFWLDPKAVPARVALGVTTLLTMSTKTASISNSLPPVAYTKVWIKVLQT